MTPMTPSRTHQSRSKSTTAPRSGLWIGFTVYAAQDSDHILKQDAYNLLDPKIHDILLRTQVWAMNHNHEISMWRLAPDETVEHIDSRETTAPGPC